MAIERPTPVNWNTDFGLADTLLQRQIFWALATISEQLDCLISHTERNGRHGYE